MGFLANKQLYMQLDFWNEAFYERKSQISRQNILAVVSASTFWAGYSSPVEVKWYAQNHDFFA